MTTKFKKIVVETIVRVPVEVAWKFWTFPEHIIRWSFASDDWHSPKAENDLRVGGKFLSRMEARDGSMGFDFEGIYEEVETNKKISYVLGDERRVNVEFIAMGKETRIIESFDAETENSIELQKNGWQAILNNFKKYTESTNHLLS